MPHLILGIDTIILRVSDLNNSVDWYTNNLGFDRLFEDKDNKLTVLDTHGPTSLTLWESESVSAVNKNSDCYPIFKTTDAKQLRDRLLTLGVSSDELQEDDAIRFFNFYDPDGKILEACEIKAD